VGVGFVWVWGGGVGGGVGGGGVMQENDLEWES